MIDFLKSNALILIILACVIGIFSIPYLVTHTTWFFHFGLDKPNEIGDTIGGILSPFIGLVSIVLIYLTIQQQIEANKAINSQFENQEKERYERTIFEYTKEQLSGLDKKIKNINKEDNLIIDFEPELPFETDSRTSEYDSISSEQFVSELAKEAIFENSFYTFETEGITEILNIISEFTSAVKLFNDSVFQEKAFIQIIEYLFSDFISNLQVNISGFDITMGSINDLLKVWSAYKLDRIKLLNNLWIEDIKLQSKLGVKDENITFLTKSERISLLILSIEFKEFLLQSMNSTQQAILYFKDQSEELLSAKRDYNEIVDTQSIFNEVLKKSDAEIRRYITEFSKG